MRIFRIKKKSGSYRTIYAPSLGKSWRDSPYVESEMARYRNACQFLTARLPVSDSAHAFSRGRSPVTNASRHIGFRFTLCFDLTDFFDSVTPGHISRIGREVERLVIYAADQFAVNLFPDGAARQGLPTSPAIANCATSRMDREISMNLIRRFGRTAYTRYADDLTISFDDQNEAGRIRSMVELVVMKHGFSLNQRKTLLQSSKAGARIITGVAVYDDRVSATREARRKLRAALHNGSNHRVDGLREWIKLKTPKQDDAPKDRVEFQPQKRNRTPPQLRAGYGRSIILTNPTP